jgi:hypothetical protein
MMMAQTHEPDRDTDIEDAVLGYLGCHPHAADTLDGIAHWWLPQQRYVTAQARIEAVLQHLVTRGVLRLRRLPNGSALYSLDSAQRLPPLH